MLKHIHTNTRTENDLLIPSTKVADKRNKNRSKDIMLTLIMDAFTSILELRNYLRIPSTLCLSLYILLCIPRRTAPAL